MCNNLTQSLAVEGGAHSLAVWQYNKLNASQERCRRKWAGKLGDIFRTFVSCLHDLCLPSHSMDQMSPPSVSESLPNALTCNARLWLAGHWHSAYVWQERMHSRRDIAIDM
jgi:hypothetical protein